MTHIDKELADLLAPSTFSIEECRARSRAARTPAELKRILLGEKRVLEARAERARLAKAAAALDCSSGKPSTPAQAAGHCKWTPAEMARIEKGKEAAQKLRAKADVRASLRDSWTRSSIGSDAGSASGWCFQSLVRKSQPRPRKSHLMLSMDFSSIRSFSERYSLDSARSMASSADVLGDSAISLDKPFP